MKTAVVYARYSCDSQTEQSIEGQLRVCQDYADRNDIMIIDTYIDRAMTGTNDNRMDFQRMIKDSSKKAWDYVLVNITSPIPMPFRQTSSPSCPLTAWSAPWRTILRV